ncbi:MAG: PD40 domain-containing protein [Chloroflexi bacterium]|nr:PD40 domain-containing protein [Chloroflexota bacterium]
MSGDPAPWRAGVLDVSPDDFGFSLYAWAGYYGSPVGTMHPKFSPDGRWLTTSSPTDDWSEDKYTIFDLINGTDRSVSVAMDDDWGTYWFTSSPDGNDVLDLAWDQEGSWRFTIRDVADNEPRPFAGVGIYPGEDTPWFITCCGASDAVAKPVAPRPEPSGGFVSLPGLNSDHYDASPSLSQDGRLVAFESDRPGGQGRSDIYLYDRDTQSLLSLPNLNSALNEGSSSISGDGRFIVFTSSQPADSGSGRTDIALYDRQTESLVSLPNLNSPEYDEYAPRITDDGRFILFLVHDGAAYALYDRQTETLLPLPEARYVEAASISGDGRYIAIRKDEWDKDARNGTIDAALYDREVDALVALSGVNSEAEESPAALSKDGRFILYTRGEIGRGDTKAYLYDRHAQTGVELPGFQSVVGSRAHTLSSDGRFIAFMADVSDGITNQDIHLYDRGEAATLSETGTSLIVLTSIVAAVIIAAGSAFSIMRRRRNISSQ